MKQFLRNLLHSVYGGAIAGLAQSAGGPVTLKTVGVALGGGALTGILHFFASKE